MLHERIDAAIKASGIKQKAIAAKLGVSEQALSALLAGRRKIGADEFFRLCVVLNKTPTELYNFPEK